MKTSTANPAVVKKKKKSFWYVFKKNLPLTIMAAPGLIVMILFRYLPMSGLLLAFKRFSVRDGIFGSCSRQQTPGSSRETHCFITVCLSCWIS